MEQSLKIGTSTITLLKATFKAITLSVMMKCCIIVIVGSFVLSLLVMGLSLSFGLMFSEILDYFDEGKGDTGWIASLNLGIMYLSGPVVGTMSKRIGYRCATVLGSVLAAAGMATSAFVNSMSYLYLTYGVITGFGFGIGNFVRVAIVNLYFEKRRSLAMGIISSGTGIGTILFSQLIEKCLKYYGWRGSFLILSGICLQGVIFGAFFRSEISANTSHERKCSNVYNLEGKQNKVEPLHKNKIKESCKSKKRTVSFLNQYFVLLKKPKLSMLLLSDAVIFMALQLPYVLLPDLIIEKGIQREYAALVMTATGMSGIFGRFLVGFLADRKGVNRFILHGLTAIVAGGATIPCGFMESFPLFVGYAVLIGIFSATCAVLQAVLLVDVVGKENIESALAIMYFIKGSLRLIGTPIGGWISDWTGSYNGAFYFAGIAYICGGITVCFIPLYTRCNTKI